MENRKGSGGSLGTLCFSLTLLELAISKDQTDFTTSEQQVHGMSAALKIDTEIEQVQAELRPSE